MFWPVQDVAKGVSTLRCVPVRLVSWTVLCVFVITGLLSADSVWSDRLRPPAKVSFGSGSASDVFGWLMRGFGLHRQSGWVFFLWLSAAFSSFLHLADSSYIVNDVTTPHLLTVNLLQSLKGLPEGKRHKMIHKQLSVVQSDYNLSVAIRC